MFTTAPTSFTSTIVAAVGTALFAGVCLFGATAPAVAAAAPQTTTVSYADINIASANGRNTLDRRIVQAARSVCENGSRDVRAMNEQTRCVDSAIADARRQVYRTSASAN
jgi:UrcA family protein